MAIRRGLTESVWHGLVPHTQLDDYGNRFAEFFHFDRNEGVLEVRLHRNGGPYFQDPASHNAWGRVWSEIGSDPENEVVIITGTGNVWFDSASSLGPTNERTSDDIAATYEDASRLLEALVFGINVPTIAAVNGPGIHTEIALACDITLSAPDATFVDPHFKFGLAPGDGQGLAMQELAGTKRAAYHLYTGSPIEASEALRIGMVNEVLDRHRLLARAHELAEEIMRQPSNARRLTHAIVSRPWKRRLVDDFGFQLFHQGFGAALADPKAG